MCDAGAEWDARLETHFRSLAASRPSQTVFGLEHGLDTGDRESLASLIPNLMHSRAERQRHWLTLVVHASEVAYKYTGDEFWPSFSNATPHWDSSGAQREELREAFTQFARDY